MNSANRSTAEAPARSDWRPQAAFGFLLSGFMSLIVSGIATVRALGLAHVVDAPGAFAPKWFGAWLFSWAVAFPVVLVVAPLVRRIVAVWFEPKSSG